jgi:hypothetical protein
MQNSMDTTLDLVAAPSIHHEQRIGASFCYFKSSCYLGVASCDWYVWIDDDIYLTNLHTPLEEQLAPFPFKDMLLSRDPLTAGLNSFNSGVLVVKDTARVAYVLQHISTLKGKQAQQVQQVQAREGETEAALRREQGSGEEEAEHTCGNREEEALRPREEREQARGRRAHEEQEEGGICTENI